MQIGSLWAATAAAVHDIAFPGAAAPSAPAPQESAPAPAPSDSFEGSALKRELEARAQAKKEAPEAAPSPAPAPAQPDLSDAEVELLLAGILLGVEGSNFETPQSLGVLGGGDFERGLNNIQGSEWGRMPSLAEVKAYPSLTAEEAEGHYWMEAAPTLNLVERSCIKAYCTFAYKMMNSYLAGTKGSPTGTMRKASECMQKAMQECTIPAGHVLHRTSGITELRNYTDAETARKIESLYEKSSPKKRAQLAEYAGAHLIGSQSTRPSFLSTSIDSKYDFIDKAAVTTEIYVGENVHGVYVGADKRLSKFDEEQEYILAPGTKMTVLGVEAHPRHKGIVLHVLAGDPPLKD